jgi:hypothetical protein
LKGCILEVYEISVPLQNIKIPGAFIKPAHGTLLAIFPRPAKAKAYKEMTTAEAENSAWKVRDWFGNAG